MASVVFLLCEISRATLAHFAIIDPIFSSRLTSVLAALIVLILWIGAAAAGAALFAPNRLGVARLADRRLRLDERLSTAIEISATPPRNAVDAVLAAAVVDDARAQIRTLDPGTMGHSWFSGWALLIPAALVLALFVPTGSAMLTQGPATDMAAAPQPNGAAQTEVGQSSPQATELVGANTAQRQSPSLGGAPAPTADAPDAGTSSGVPSRQDATQAVGRLVSQDLAEDGEAPDSAQQSQASQALSKQVLALQSPPARPEVVDKTLPPPQDAKPPPRSSAQQQQRRPQPNVNNPEQAPVALKDAPAAHAGNGYDEAFTTFQRPQQSSADAQMTLTQQQQIEAAENAYSGGGQAGDGTRPLGNGGSDAQLADLLAHDAGQLSLPQAIGTEGERISVKVAPTTETEPAPSYAAARSDAWTSAPDQAVARHEIHPWERDILARYFRPDADGQ